jgi:gluconokinase
VVFIITGASESDRNTVGRLLAETLGWEFVDAENLRAQGNVDAGGDGTSRPHADRTWLVEILSAAINLWIYEWRDVAVSCPVLTAAERQQFCKMSTLVKVVCLEAFPAPGQTLVVDQSAGVVEARLQTKWHGSGDSEQEMLTIDASRQVDEIIAEMTAVLMT